MNERVGKRVDGIMTFPPGGDIEDAIIAIHEHGMRAGMDDYEIAEAVLQYLEAKYARSLN